MPTSLQQLIGAAQTSSPISKTFLIVNSRVFGVSAIPQVVYDAQSVLDDLGLNLLEITADLQGSILTVNSYPIIDSDRIESIAMLVSEKLI